MTRQNGRSMRFTGGQVRQLRFASLLMSNFDRGTCGGRVSSVANLPGPSPAAVNGPLSFLPTAVFQTDLDVDVLSHIAVRFSHPQDICG